MKLFGPLYSTTLKWSRHPKAVWYLGGVSFIESSFFPVPTSFMLAPMVLAQRLQAWRLALLCTITSSLGGLFGYLVGHLLFEQVGTHILEFYDLQRQFESIQIWYKEYGVWLLFLSGLTPIPYKLFTIASGTLGMAIIPFFLISVVGRGSQFFLVAALVRWGGEKLEPALNQHIEKIGWLLLVAAVGGFLVLRLFE
ncbi:MAG: DedA family protein [Gammaproteobacteria bacterium]|nr:DedA family protein [Gammaproteobacteria bacterium]